MHNSYFLSGDLGTTPFWIYLFFLLISTHLAVELTVLTCRINNKKNNTYWFSGPSKHPAGRQKIKWAVIQYKHVTWLKQAGVYIYIYIYTRANIRILWASNQSLSRECCYANEYWLIATELYERIPTLAIYIIPVRPHTS